jgi:hypothetical protein
MDKLTPQEQRELDALARTGLVSDKGRSVHEEHNSFVQSIYELGRIHEREKAGKR